MIEIPLRIQPDSHNRQAPGILKGLLRQTLSTSIVNSGIIHYWAPGNISAGLNAAIEDFDYAFSYRGYISVTNSGTILSENTGAIELGIGSSVNNSGTIQSENHDLFAIKLGDSSSLVNTGTIDGNVLGVSQYDGRYGVVHGTVVAAIHGDSTLLGSLSNPNTMEARPGGNGTLVGGNEIDHLYGSNGNDTLHGGGGDDVLEGGLGNDLLDGGTGSSTASYAHATEGVTVSLATSAQQDTGGAGLDTLSHIRHLAGPAFADTLTGDGYANRLYGGGGDDTLNGGGGDDRLYGGVGTNILNGGAGIDTAEYSHATAAVTVSLAITGAQDTHGAGIDTLIGIEVLGGSAFDDTLTGGGSFDVLVGRDGNDTLTGGAGVNQLYGGGGDDTLIGGASNDIFNGGPGSDTMTGGAGKDGFIFDASLGATNIDTITDFNIGQDFFQLSRAIFAAAGPDGTLAASAFHIGAAQTADQHILYDNTTGNLYYDADGNGAGAAVEFAHIDAHLALTAASFHIYG